MGFTITGAHTECLAEGCRAIKLYTEIDRLRAAFLLRIQADNQCYAWQHDKKCDAEHCGCLLEMQGYIDEADKEKLEK